MEVEPPVLKVYILNLPVFVSLVSSQERPFMEKIRIAVVLNTTPNKKGEKPILVDTFDCFYPPGFLQFLLFCGNLICLFEGCPLP